MKVVSIGQADIELQELLARKADKSASETKRLMSLMREIAIIVNGSPSAEKKECSGRDIVVPGRSRRNRGQEPAAVAEDRL